jgi:hypothetical protein
MSKSIQRLVTGNPAVREETYERSVFLNLAYGRGSERFLVAYVTGVTALGLVPVLALDRADSERRLDHIQRMLHACAYSLHDLQNVGSARWNMILELGMAIGTEEGHRWLVLDSDYHRAFNALSDLNGTDISEHGGTPLGVLGALLNLFAHRNRNLTTKAVERIYKQLLKRSFSIRKSEGAKSLFERRVFRRLVTEATVMTQQSAIARGHHGGTES